MNVAFFHDSIFIKKENTYYTSGTLNDELFKFYLEFFKEITVVTRYVPFDPSKKKYINSTNKISLDQVKVHLVPSYQKARKIVKEEMKKCDVAIIRCHSFIGTIAAYYAKKYKKKYIAESVSCAFDCLWYHSTLGKFIAPFLYLFTKQAIKNATAVTYVSSKFLQERYPNKHKTLSCSDVVIDKVYKADTEKWKSIQNRKINLGNIANLDMKYKGQSYLIKAAAKLRKEGFDIDLFFVGGGSGDRLKKLVARYHMEKNVHFLGPLPHEKIFDFLKSLDLYVQPSNAESHGRVIVEAMSVGCPVIGSNVGGIPELVHPDFIFKKKNATDLYKTIKKNLSSSKIIESSKYSYQMAKNFEQKKLYTKRKNFYKTIMEDLK